MSKQIVKASCHCKAATFTFTIPSDTRKANRCNCTWCQKPTFTSLSVEPEGFKLLTPASQEELGDYYPRGPQGNNFGHRYFCKTCATHLWREGQYEYPEGKLNKFFTVNLSTIDQPQEGVDLKNFSISYADGLGDNFMAGVQDKPWKGGLV